MCRRSSGSVFILFYFCTGGPGGCPGKIPEKLISVFIITAPLTEAAKKRLVKGVFNRDKCPGAEVRICRPAGWDAPEPRAENFIYELQAEQVPRGGGGWSREAPAFFRLIPALCKSHFFQIRYVPAGLLSRYGCKVSAGFYI